MPLLFYRLTCSLVLIAVIVATYRLASVLIRSRNRLRSFTGLDVQDALIPFVRTGLQLLVFAFGIVFLIQVWGYDVTGLIAGLGLGGLAFSLAAQDTLSNLFGFSMIVEVRRFVVGEFIKTPDVEGIVERVGLRSTRVRQQNQALVTVPNSTLASSAVLNWSRLEKRWIDFKLGIHYGATPEQMEALLEHLRVTLRDWETVDPESVIVHFIEFGDSALQVLIRAYVMKANWLEFTEEREKINLAVMRIVSDVGLTIAYPTRSLYIEKMPEMNGGLQSVLNTHDAELQRRESPESPSTGDRP